MDIVIFKSDLHDRYDNNDTWDPFRTQDTVINAIIEGSDWIIRATFLIRGKPIVSSATFLKSYSDVISIYFW